jgi:L-lysine 2,3-aminomutase
LSQCRATVWTVVHVNHANEIDEEVTSAISGLIDAGIPVLSQTVLLRGVNDQLHTLAELMEKLIDLRVLPYYLHQLDAVAGAAHFEVPAEVGRRLIEQLRAQLPGYAVPRYVQEVPGRPAKEILG